MLPRRRYTVRHAVVMSAAVWIVVFGWTVWAWMVALPLHPWISVAVLVAVLVTAYFFAVFEGKGRRVISRLISIWNVTILVAVAAAAGFGAAGGPFPWWAAAPCVMVLVALGFAVLWFGLVSLYRYARYGWITRRLYTTLPPQEFERSADR